MTLTRPNRACRTLSRRASTTPRRPSSPAPPPRASPTTPRLATGAAPRLWEAAGGRRIPTLTEAPTELPWDLGWLCLSPSRWMGEHARTPIEVLSEPEAVDGGSTLGAWRTLEPAHEGLGLTGGQKLVKREFNRTCAHTKRITLVQKGVEASFPTGRTRTQGAPLCGLTSGQMLVKPWEKRRGLFSHAASGIEHSLALACTETRAESGIEPAEKRESCPRLARHCRQKLSSHH